MVADRRTRRIRRQTGARRSALTSATRKLA